MVVVATWERAGPGIPDHTTQSGLVQIGSQGHEDGTTDGRLSVAYKIATSSGATSYQAYTTSGSGTVYTGCIVLYGHSTSGIVQASSTQTNNQVPNPPQVTGLTGDFLVLIASGWHLATASYNTVAPGANYTEEWEVGVSTDLEFGLATRALTGLSGASEDPPAWSDNVAPNGTSSITIAIKSAATYDESLTASAASGSAQTSTGTFNHAVPASSLIRQGHAVTVLTRKAQPPPAGAECVAFLTGDPTQEGDWMAAVPDHDWVINLAGASIFARWTAEKKQEIYDSRILTTRNLVKAIAAGHRVQLFCSTSAPGYFGDRGEEQLTEDSPAGYDFLGQVARDWENEALKAQELGVRVAITRFGVVLGREGGILGQLVPLFKSFVGGPVGNGRQWFSWIHQVDLARAFLFLPDHPELTGPVHFCAPHPVRNRDLARDVKDA